MKAKNKFAAMLTVVTVGVTSSLSSVQAFSESSNSENKRKPELVFPVISDVHIDDGSTADMNKFRTAMDQLNKVAPKQDAFVVVGDLTDYGYATEYDKFFSVYNEKKQADVQSMFTMGNHDYWNGLSVEKAQDRFLEKSGMDSLYYHKKVNGYDFIALSPENGNTHGLYSVNQINWLGEKLAAAEKENPDQPIFVFLHQHIKDTVYGSDLWGTQENKELLYDTLKKHPQVITFSGHSHYPLEDPRTIHQKDFTSVGTSSVSYLELEPGKLQGFHPEGYRDISQGMVVEVYNNEVIIKKRDFHKDDWTGKPWVIKNPSKKNKFKYTDDRDQLSPSFAGKDEASIVKEKSTLRSLNVTFPQAKDNVLVHSYHITAKNKESGELDADFTAFSEFYLDPVPKNLEFPVTGLKPGTDYEIKVQALDSFNNSSKKVLLADGQTKALEMVSAQASPSLVTTGESTTLQVKMKNFGNDSVKGKIKVDAPEGWSVEQNELEYELSGSEEKNLSIKAIPSKESSGSSQFTITAYEGGQIIGSKNINIFVNMMIGESFDQLDSALKPAVNENIPSSILGWSHTAPNGWSVTNSSNMPAGTEEWQGWSFTTKEFWTKAEDQDRSKFELGQGVIAVADPDEWDDNGSPASKGFFDSTLTSSSVKVEGAKDLYVGFASHYKQEGTQTAEVTAVFDNGEKQQVLVYDNKASSDNKNEHVLNKYEVKSIKVPEDASSMKLQWRMHNAKNNWFWSIDDIRLDDQMIVLPN
ncbi:metallophosphoesterase [Peribacillus frigoritolerans]|uniref:metallophosphoesterase n=1 Tax=Peribacillus frigoritolerans TaxID=450367 RepID=UPI002E244C26|nr:metallophosphoesterase [Peribacillus frigoritolerans]MED4635548.1 metallophosphoesterase [Peribacillus frigoritolerans]